METKTVKFTYDIVAVTKLIIQRYVDEMNKTEPDQSKRMAANDVIYSQIEDHEIEDALRKWSKANNGELTIFKNGLEDAKIMWAFIAKSEKYRKSLKDHICKGFSGMGVYDTCTDKFWPCSLAGHYETIKKLLEQDHLELWEVHEAFIKSKTDDSTEVDNFILNDLVLVGKSYNQEYYTVENQEY